MTALQSYAPALDPFTRGNSVSLLEEGESVRAHCETERLADADLAPYQAFEERWLREQDGSEGGERAARAG